MPSLSTSDRVRFKQVEFSELLKKHFFVQPTAIVIVLDHARTVACAELEKLLYGGWQGEFRAAVITEYPSVYTDLLAHSRWLGAFLP